MSYMKKAGTLAGIGTLALGLAACSGEPEAPETTPAAPPVVAEPTTEPAPVPEPTTEAPAPTEPANPNVIGTVSAFEIPTPSCFNTDQIESGSEVELLDCNTPHDSEAYASYEFTDATFPGDEVVEQTANQFCYDEFQAYIGTPWDTSEFDFYFLIPTQESWDGVDDREVLCIVQSPTMESASMAGSGR